MRTNELIGPLLDAWVAKAEGLDAHVEYLMVNPPKPVACWLIREGGTDFASGPYSPSTDPALAHAIILRHGIATEPGGDGWQALAGEYFSTPAAARKRQAVNGPTLLIAAMRARVMLAFGETVGSPT